MKKVLAVCLLMVMGCSSVPSRPSCVYRKVDNLFTRVWIENPGKKDLYIRFAAFEVTKIDEFTPKPKSFPYDDELSFRTYSKSTDGKIVLSTHDVVKIAPSKTSMIRVRIQNKDFPGISLTGDLSLSYYNDRDKPGFIVVEGLTIDVESW